MWLGGPLIATGVDAITGYVVATYVRMTEDVRSTGTYVMASDGVAACKYGPAGVGVAALLGKAAGECESRSGNLVWTAWASGDCETEVSHHLVLYHAKSKDVHSVGYVGRRFVLLMLIVLGLV